MGRAERIQLARDITQALIERHGDDVVATGLHGSIARGEDTDLSDLDLAVITSRPGAIESRSVLLGPTVVELRSVTAATYLDEAAHIDGRWPLRADQYSTHVALHDPAAFFPSLRRTYDTAISSASDETWRRAAAAALMDAVSHAYKARARLGRDEAGAVVALGQTALSAVCYIGLTVRFAFRNESHAIRIAPDLPGAPPAFAGPFRAAFAITAPNEAVTSMENAVEVLVKDGLERDLPFTAEEPSEFA